MLPCVMRDASANQSHDERWHYMADASKSNYITWLVSCSQMTWSLWKELPKPHTNR